MTDDERQDVIAKWQPIETAPKDGREQILLKVPYNQDGVLAWSNTWWMSGFSVENKPTHWKPAPPSNAWMKDTFGETTGDAVIHLLEGTK